MQISIRLAIVGVGQIAVQSHLPAALACEAVRVTALVDAMPARAKEVARRFGISPVIASDVQDVLGKVDAAVIATPNDMHGPIALRCLRAGIATLIEKPLAHCYADGLRIVEAAESNGTVLAVGYCSRFRENVRLLKELLDSRYVGRATRFVHQSGSAGGWAPMSAYNLDRSQSGGGVLVVTGSHFLDRMIHFWGYPDEARLMDDSDGGPEANCRAIFRYSQQADIEGYAIYSKTVSLPSVLIVETDKGCLIAPDSDDAEIIFRPFGNGQQEHVIRRRGGPTQQVDVFRLQLQDFIAAHVERRPPLISGRHGLQSLRLIEQLYACRTAMTTDWYGEESQIGIAHA